MGDFVTFVVSCNKFVIQRCKDKPLNVQTVSFNTQQFHIVHLSVCFVSQNSDVCPIQHKLTGFYNRDEKCLQRGTDWVFKYDRFMMYFYLQ